MVDLRYVFHPSIHHLYTLYVRRLILCRVAGGLEPIPADLGRRQGTPWTGRQSIAGQVCFHVLQFGEAHLGSRNCHWNGDCNPQGHPHIWIHFLQFLLL